MTLKIFKNRNVLNEINKIKPVNTLSLIAINTKVLFASLRNSFNYELNDIIASFIFANLCSGYRNIHKNIINNN